MPKGIAFHSGPRPSNSPTGKGWPKGKKREHRIVRDRDLGTPEARMFFARWAQDVRAECQKAVRRANVFSYLDFDCSERGAVGPSELPMGPSGVYPG